MSMKYPDKPFLNEFVLETADAYPARKIIDAAAAAGILAGVELTENNLMVCATEMCSPEDIEKYVSLVNSL